MRQWVLCSRQTCGMAEPTAFFMNILLLYNFLVPLYINMSFLRYKNLLSRKVIQRRVSFFFYLWSTLYPSCLFSEITILKDTFSILIY